MARLLGSDYAQAAVNQQVLHRLLQEINSDDELINLTSIRVVLLIRKVAGTNPE
jgi:hypothetical protein